MKLLSSLIVALAALPAALAMNQKMSAIVSFDEPTPDIVIEEAKNFLVEAGGKVIHTYTIIKGFDVIAPEKALQIVQAWDTGHSMTVEEVKEATIQ
ncbi:hypothetical protein J3458_005271 [Metarhizium acridum]|uniref:uncharacterized protein n=1 Tax=Metarhizium acridum TaxID=92637 RepID=UPI001C6B4A98|nr:hypothetical protein J3458_005271 [Metarhizium acridum]